MNDNQLHIGFKRKNEDDNYQFVKQESVQINNYGLIQNSLLHHNILQNNFNIIQTPINFGHFNTVELDSTTKQPEGPSHAEFAYEQQLKYRQLKSISNHSCVKF